MKKDIGKGRVDGINSDTEDQRRARQSIMRWILSISSKIQQHCRREFLIQPRIQYFDNMTPVQEFFPAAVPIISVTELSNDPLGLFTGGEFPVPVQDYAISAIARSVFILFNYLLAGKNAIRLTYLGGLAYHATQSTMTLSGVTGAGNILPGYFAYGNTGEAMAKVISFNAGTGVIVLDNIAGVFLPLEALTFQPTQYAQDIANTGATVASIDRQSLCEAFPEIATAVEIELRFMEKHEFDFENQTDGGKYGATHRTQADLLTDDLQPETCRLLRHHVRILMGT